MAKNSKTAATLAARAAKRAAATHAPSAGSSAADAFDPPYGYVEVDGELAPSADEGAIIERIRELAKKRMHPRDIVAQLNKEELDARGNPWSVKGVTRILRRKVTPDSTSNTNG